MEYFPEDALEEPQVDVLENDNNFIVKANMIAYNKNDIHIEYDDVRKLLKISSEAQLKEKFLKERFSYLTTVPANITGQPHAKFQNGNLEIVFNLDRSKPEMHVTDVAIN